MQTTDAGFLAPQNGSGQDDHVELLRMFELQKQNLETGEVWLSQMQEISTKLALKGGSADRDVVTMVAAVTHTIRAQRSMVQCLLFLLRGLSDVADDLVSFVEAQSCSGSDEDSEEPESQ